MKSLVLVVFVKQINNSFCIVAHSLTMKSMTKHLNLLFDLSHFLFDTHFHSLMNAIDNL